MKHGIASLAAAASVAASCWTSAAVAQEAPAAPPSVEPPSGGVRFRGGLASELVLMSLVDPMEGYVGSTFQGHVGVQLGDIVGVYAVPYVGFIAGIGGGPYVGSAIMTDFTIADSVGIGIGPELAYFDKIAGRGHHEGAQAAIRLRGAVYPLTTIDDDGSRSGLALGVDLRVIGASVGFADCLGCEQGGPLMLSSGVFVGYEVY